MKTFITPYNLLGHSDGIFGSTGRWTVYSDRITLVPYYQSYTGFDVNFPRIVFSNGQILTGVCSGYYNSGVMLRHTAIEPSRYDYAPAQNGYNVLASDSGLWIARDNLSLGSANIVVKPSQIRAEANGSTLRAKRWNGTEPGWQITATDGTYSSGLAGAFIWTTGTAHLYTGIGISAGTFNADLNPTKRTISGTVTLGGNPVAGATVTAERYGLSGSERLIVGVHYVSGTTNQNGQYTLTFNTEDPGPWVIKAFAIINNVYYTSDARLVLFD